MIRKPALLLGPLLLLAGCFLPPPAAMGPAALPPAPTQAPGGAVPVAAPAVPGERPPAPPWYPPGTDALSYVEKAGFEPLQAEGQLYHIHAHLSVFWDRAPVVVPANIGISSAGIWISALHTHDNQGILHVEANVTEEVRLGQFFTEWNVSLGGATVYDNGQPVADGPSLVLRDMQAIAVVWGPPPDRIPDRYPLQATPTPAPAHQAASQATSQANGP